MDMSETYQKMCDCEEVQNQWRRFSVDVSQDSLVWGGESERNHDMLWLPRQDQIQEMLQLELHELLELCSESVIQEALYRYAESFEQLWLAVYMDEKHGKAWDGKEWIRG